MSTQPTKAIAVKTRSADFSDHRQSVDQKHALGELCNFGVQRESKRKSQSNVPLDVMNAKCDLRVTCLGTHRIGPDSRI